MFESIRKPTINRGPFGIITGPPNTGKTSHAVLAFPDYLKIGSRDGSFPGAKAFASERLGIDMPRDDEDSFLFIPTRRKVKVKKGDQIVELDNQVPPEFYDHFIGIFRRLIDIGKARIDKQRQEGKPVIPGLRRKNMLVKDDSYCNTFPGVIWSEFNFALAWADEAAKNKFGRSYEQSNLIKQLIPLISELNASAGIGLILDMHWVEQTDFTDKEGNSLGKIKYPAGPAVPYGHMRRDLVASSNFCIRIDTNSKGKRTAVLGGDLKKESLKLQTYNGKTVDNYKRDLGDNLTIRDILNEYGYNLPPNPDPFSEGYRKENPERFK